MASIRLTNMNSLSPVDFSISVRDTLEGLGVPGWLEVTPMDGTIDAGGFIDLSVTMNSALLSDTTYNYKGIVFADYGSWSDLKIPVFFEVLCNNQDYSAEDSDAPSAFDFEWIDITQTGTRLEPEDFYNTERPLAALDDGTAGPIDIGFPFNFYNDVFGTIYVGVNGGLSFVSEEVNVNGYMADLSLPSPGIEALLLPFWNDLTIDSVDTGHGAIYYYRSAANDSLVIEYYQVGNYGHANDSLITFEVVLTSDHTISYRYLDVGIYDLSFSATVGTSRDEGCRMVKYYRQGIPSANLPHDLLRVDFVPMYTIEMRSGDTNGSGNIDIDDVVYLVTYIFGGGPAPVPIEAGDCDCSENIDIDDVVYLVTYIFSQGPEPCRYLLD